MQTDPAAEVTKQPEAKLDRLVSEVVWQAREHVMRLKAEDRIISKHYDYPRLDHFDSGQPNVKYGDGPTDFGGVFKRRASDRWHVSFDELPALDELGQLAIDDEHLRARLLAPNIDDMTEWRERWVTMSAALIPLGLLDRLMHTAGEDFSEKDLRDAWQPVRNSLVWDKLPIDIVVPVALVAFDLDEPVELSGNVTLERMPEDEQRARVPRHIYDAAANPMVLAAASHAVVIRGYELPGVSQMVLEYSEPWFYPQDEIELAFQALRIATTNALGYAQTYMRPIDWAWHYDADLPPIIRGSVARRYPPAFDDGGWLSPPKVVTATEINDAASTLAELHKAGRPLKLASRRFSGAALRAEDDDVILDLCIALEVALGDRSRTEMTYKLGMRAAGIIALATPDEIDGASVLKQVKRLYDWRSALAHGGDEEKARRKFIEVVDGDDGIEAATGLLRRVLRQLVQRPELRDPAAIDGTLLQPKVKPPIA